MNRYILADAPGSGKTSVLRVLQAWGYVVVDEAATDVIAHEQSQGHGEPWNDLTFVDKIIAVQRQRQEEPAGRGVGIQVYDRSPICTLALAHYLDHPITATLIGEIDRIISERIYDRRVFFIRPIGFVEPTAARTITFEDSLKFERVHEDAYLTHGFEIVDIPPGAVAERASRVAVHLQTHT